MKKQNIIGKIRNEKGIEFDHYINEVYLNYKERSFSENRKEYAVRNGLTENELKSIIDYARKEYGVDSKRIISQNKYPSFKENLPSYSLENILLKENQKCLESNIIPFETPIAYSESSEKYNPFAKKAKNIARVALYGGLAALMSLQVAAKDIFNIDSTQKPTKTLSANEVIARGSRPSLWQYFFGNKTNEITPVKSEVKYVERIVNSHGTKVKIPVHKEEMNTNTAEKLQIAPSVPSKKYEKNPEFPKTPLMPPVEYIVATNNFNDLNTNTIFEANLPVDKIKLPEIKLPKENPPIKTIQENKNLPKRGVLTDYRGNTIAEIVDGAVMPPLVDVIALKKDYKLVPAVKGTGRITFNNKTIEFSEGKIRTFEIKR